MESLILRGHASLSEDSLTAALADLLEDLDDLTLVHSILPSLRSVAADGKLLPLHPGVEWPFDRFELQLWPSWPECGEPDLLLTLEKDGAPVAAIAIEVKYEAAKSGEDTEEGDGPEDQLGRYAAGLENRFPSAIKRVVYLTASSVPPSAELAASWTSIAKWTLLDPAETLRWLSWRSVDRLLRDRLPPDSIGRRRTNRVLRLLEKAGLRCFEGWPLDGVPPDLPAPPNDIPNWLKVPGRWRVELAPGGTLGPPPVSARPKKHVGWWIGPAPQE